ncbi:hypothetical protein BC830DRAFT_1115865 [Chytriomyces sp. MP71]|nr:hypothetical protein BC830DRAFT_1115865 [Chytriomyces sp. MP71]
MPRQARQRRLEVRIKKYLAPAWIPRSVRLFLALLILTALVSLPVLFLRTHAAASVKPTFAGDRPPPASISNPTVLPDPAPMLKILDENGQTQTCPFWPPVPTMQEDNLDPTTCGQVPSLLSEEWVLTLCYKLGTCRAAGYWLIERLDKRWCKGLPSGLLVADALNATDVNTFSLSVSYEGPQMYRMRPSYHMGNCVFKVLVDLQSPGNFTANIVIYTYANASKTREASATLVGQYLVRNHSVAVCPGCRPLNPADMRPLPVCPRANTNEGEYLKVNKAVSYVWTPYSCRYDQLFQSHTNDTCLSNPRTIHFLGDTPMCDLYNDLRFRLAGKPQPLYDTRLEDIPFTSTLSNLTLYYTHDPFLYLLAGNITAALHLLRDADTLVVGLGAAPRAEEWDPVMADAYFAHLVGMLVRLRERRGAHGLRVVWVGPMLRPGNEKWDAWGQHVWMKRVGRGMRALLWKKGMWDIYVDAPRLTEAWMAESVKEYRALPARAAIVDETLHKLNLCNV